MGDPSDPVYNCALLLCCEAAEAEATFAKALHSGVATFGGTGDAPDPQQLTERQCAAVAQWVYAYFDLAEKGTLQPLKDSIARLVRA